MPWHPLVGVEYANVMRSTPPAPDATVAVPAARLSEAGRALQRPTRRRPPEDLRVRVPIDARTRAGRVVAELKAALLAHLGARPSAAALALVEQLLQLKLRLVTMDELFLGAGGSMSAHDSRVYLAWSNSFTRGLRQLGLEAPPERAPSIAEALAAATREPLSVAAGAPGPTLAAVPAPPPRARLGRRTGP